MKNKILKISILIILIIAIIIIIGCEYDYGIKQGTIIDKQYRTEYITYTYTTSYVGSSIIRTPIPLHQPETYNIHIQKEEEGKTKDCWIEITKEEYEKYNIGDYYNK